MMFENIFHLSDEIYVKVDPEMHNYDTNRSKTVINHDLSKSESKANETTCTNNSSLVYVDVHDWQVTLSRFRLLPDKYEIGQSIR